MANELTTPPAFGGFQRHGTTVRDFLKYTAAIGWTDRDSAKLQLGTQFICVGCHPFIGHWHKNDEGRNVLERRPSSNYGTDDAKALSEAIPREQWPIGLNGQPEEPYKKFVSVQLIAPNGKGFVYEASTYGARMTVIELEEAILNAQFLYGADYRPIVALSEKLRKMPPPVGQLKCPHFEVLPPKEPPRPLVDATPQLGGPAPAEPAAAPSTAAAAEPVTSAPQAKPKVQLDQFAGMKPAQPRPTGEILDDELPY